MPPNRLFELYKVDAAFRSLGFVRVPYKPCNVMHLATYMWVKPEKERKDCPDMSNNNPICPNCETALEPYGHKKINWCCATCSRTYVTLTSCTGDTVLVPSRSVSDSMIDSLKQAINQEPEGEKTMHEHQKATAEVQPKQNQLVDIPKLCQDVDERTTRLDSTICALSHGLIGSPSPESTMKAISTKEDSPEGLCDTTVQVLEFAVVRLDSITDMALRLVSSLTGSKDDTGATEREIPERSRPHDGGLQNYADQE